MNAKQLHEEIKGTNLSYMGLAQKMIRADKAGASSSLGVSEEVADWSQVCRPRNSSRCLEPICCCAASALMKACCSI